MKNTKNKRAFTLIEMIVVMTIVMLLAVLVVGSMGYVQGKQAREKAKAQIALLSKAIEEYKMDMGVYPGEDDNTAIDGDVSDQLYQDLFKDGYDYTSPDDPPPTWTLARKIYLAELDPRDNKQGWVRKLETGDPVPAYEDIVDPWGNPYRYRKGDNAQNPDFDLWSMGKDGKTNPGGSDADLKDKVNKDDIRNF